MFNGLIYMNRPDCTNQCTCEICKIPKNKDRKLLSSLFDTSSGDHVSSPNSPTGSPLSNKPCQEDDPNVSNADILRAVNALTDRFTSMEQQIAQKSVTIVNLSKMVDFVGEELKSLSTRVKTNDNKVLQIEQVIRMVRDKCDQAEIYSRKWNLRLINLKETDGENIRNRVLEILKILTLDETDDIRFSQFIELDVSERGVIALGRFSFSSRSEFTERKFGELHLRKEVSI